MFVLAGALGAAAGAFVPLAGGVVVELESLQPVSRAPATIPNNEITMIVRFISRESFYETAEKDKHNLLAGIFPPASGYP